MCKSLKYGKRLLALLLVCVIVSSTTYKAHAAAAVPVVVSAGEAIAYVLGILGITAGAGYVIDKKDEIASWGSDQIGKLKEWTKTNSDKVNAWGAATSQEIESSIDAWFEKLRTGTLDTASAVWDSIKAWGGSIYDNLHGGSVVSEYLGGLSALSNGYSYSFLYSYSALNCSIINNSDVVYGAVFYAGDTMTLAFCSPESFRLSFTSSNGKDSQIYSFGDVSYYCVTYTLSYVKAESISGCGLPVYDRSLINALSDYEIMSLLLGMSIDIPADEYTTVGGVSDIFDRDKSLDNIGVAVPGIAAGATDIPIDWGLVGDIAGTLTDVRAGVKDIADTLADAKVFPIDTTRDTVIDSDGDLSNDKAKDDVIPAVPNVGTLDDYKLAGLEKVFPFCIPFDLMSFLGVLAADPEAPVFDWPITYPTLSGSATYTLHIDLSDFDPVAKIVRDMECLGFIMGLIMITRDKMIMG